MKDKLVFDTTNATTIADSDSVGAYLRSSDGTLLTHTDVSGKKALDVRVAEGINVEVDLNFADDSVTAHQGGTWVIDSITNPVTVTATDLDIRDLSHTQDSVKVGDGTDFLAVNADGSVNITDNGGSLTVDATDLDIRDLAFATDSVTAHQGGTWTIDSITNPVTVTATDLDIRDLSAAQDSVEAWAHDGAGTALTSTLVGAKQALDVNVVAAADAALANTAIAAAAETLDVANTSQDVVASPLANRKYLFIYNKDNQQMFIGQSGVTAANGFPISPSSYLEIRAGAAVDIEFVSAKTNHEIRTLELS
jgi:hypothetical protein